ncbi:hypothetical protein K3495_g1802 [Podosphaera aphanis]|nr:hypothetical protein K3495_g1802 [Podosphaera aphanis]
MLAKLTHEQSAKPPPEAEGPDVKNESHTEQFFQDFEARQEARDRDLTRRLEALETDRVEREKELRKQDLALMKHLNSLEKYQTNQATASETSITNLNKELSSQIKTLTNAQRLQALNFDERLEKFEKWTNELFERLENLAIQNSSRKQRENIVQPKDSLHTSSKPSMQYPESTVTPLPLSPSHTSKLFDTTTTQSFTNRTALENHTSAPQKDLTSTFKWSLYPHDNKPDNSSKRLPDGSLNLNYKPTRYVSNLTEQERMVKSIWPDAKAKSDLLNFTGTSDKNKTFVRQELQLVRADHTIFAKLKEIQTLFQTSLIPYNFWPQRLASELKGDFQRVGLYIGSNNPDWITTLEAIFQVMVNRNALHSPVSDFCRFAPKTNKTPADIAWRLRTVYYRMPVDAQESRFCKSTLIDHIMDYLPHVWSHMRYESTAANSTEIVEMLVARTIEISKWHSTFQPPFQEENAQQTRLTISDPRNDSLQVFKADDRAPANNSASVTD